MKVVSLMYLIGILFMVNCASPANRDKMTLKDFEANKKNQESIFVEKSTGGSKTYPFWVSKISDEDFSNALKDSIKNSKSFADLSDSSEKGFVLKTEIREQEQPYFSFNTKCRVIVKYSLFKSGSLVKEFTIEESASANLSDSLRPVKRVSIANEIAAKKNISKFLKELN